MQFVAPVLTLRLTLTLPTTLRFGTPEDDPWGVPRKQTVVRSRPVTRPFAVSVSRSLEIEPDSGVLEPMLVIAIPAELRPFIKKVSASDFITRAEMRKMCLPAAYARGWYTVPASLLAKTEDKLSEELHRRTALVRNVTEQMPQMRKTAPPPGSKWVTNEQLLEAFEVRKEYLSISCSTATQGISERLHQEQMIHWQKGQEKLAAKCRILLRGDLLNSVNALRILCDDQLRSVHIGSPHITEHALTRLQFQARIFAERDATGDSSYCTSARAILSLLDGVTVTALRKYTPVRDYILGNLQTIETQMKLALTQE